MVNNHRARRLKKRGLTKKNSRFVVNGAKSRNCSFYIDPRAILQRDAFALR